MKHALLSLSFVLAACVSFEREPPATTRYALEVARPLGGEGQGEGPALQVRTFHPSPASAGRKLVYKTAAAEVETDFYHEFLVPPALAITELTRDWLAASRRFRTVRGAGGAVAADWVLEGDLLALHADQRAGGPAAVLELHVIVVARDEREVVLEKRYAAREPVADAAPASVVAGWERALAAVLTELELDLGRVP